ncbi:hypothetical protein ACA910_014455 [Epithemia clementina (nom. ined.)]
MSGNLSGLAASIRGAVDNETFDLAGKNASTIEHAIADAFQTPFTLSETIRITFVTGAGKLARQKYDEGAAKAITSKLREFGYEEDQSGGAGTFKLQHDTGKNLKTVVVYPQITTNGGTGTESIEAGTNALSISGGGASLLPEGSPEHKIAYTSMNIFERMITSMCQTWSQKKGCVAAIDDIKALVKTLDEKLLAGTPLSDAEQSFYDDVSLSSLEEKQSTLREMMQKQVDNAMLTMSEKRQLLDQVQERIDKLEKEAETSNNKKRLEQVTTALTKALERQEKLSSTVPRPPPPLKKQAEIQTLRVELKPLLALEASTKGRLLTLKENQSLARKQEIEQEIRVLELASRGGFESDEAFQARVDASRAAFAKQQAAAKPKKATTLSSASAASKSTGVAWASATPANRTKKPAAAASKAKPKGGGVFAAMMNDSDSD